jgi:hypothetical protein
MPPTAGPCHCPERTSRARNSRSADRSIFTSPVGDRGHDPMAHRTSRGDGDQPGCWIRQVRKAPWIRIGHDHVYAMVASQGRSSAHPRWYSNLVADPLVELRAGTHSSDRVAREVLVAERDQWWGGPLLPFQPTPSSSYGPSGSSPCSYSSPFPTDRQRRDRQAGLPACRRSGPAAGTHRRRHRYRI